MNKLALVLALAGAAWLPVSAQAPVVLGGGWPDGTTLEWLCLPGQEFTAPFQFTLPDGKQYQGAIVCDKEA